jgi:hypothetical protein
MAEILEQKQLPNGNIHFHIAYTVDEAKGIGDSLALFFLEQFDNEGVEDIELPEWSEADSYQTVSNKMLFKESLESAGMKIVAKDGSHYVVLEDNQ